GVDEELDGKGADGRDGLAGEVEAGDDAGTHGVGDLLEDRGVAVGVDFHWCTSDIVQYDEWRSRGLLNAEVAGGAKLNARRTAQARGLCHLVPFLTRVLRGTCDQTL